jgi:A/G-specific adenine glycosylase
MAETGAEPGADGGGDASALLLAWYDAHARDLPWRVLPAARAAGQRADPYRVWLSEVMLQQTTVAAVKGYFDRFTKAWPTVNALAAAEDASVMSAWAGLGYYARARNLLACARAVVDRHGGVFPDDPVALRALPGVGAYTAAAVAAIAFDRAETVVDGNVERVVARLFAVETPMPKAKPDLVRRAAAITPVLRPGDHAQAMMDLGATVCTPRRPACMVCPLSGLCRAHALGLAADLPSKMPKPAKPERTGRVWIARREDGAVLVEQRPAKGLLGGMTGFPGDGWDGEPGDSPLDLDWQSPGHVRHTFTHFHLTLQVHCGLAPMGANPMRGQFQPGFSADALPTLMRKAWDLASSAGSDG